jgi:hypothetical protein
MSFWTDFETLLTKAVKAAEADVVLVAQYFKPKLVAGAEEIATIALQAVLAQAPKLISGSEKLSAATSAVVSAVSASGKTIAVNIAETAVQAAVNALTPVKTP